MRELVACLHGELERLPTQSVPLIGLDLSDGCLKIHVNGTGWIAPSHSSRGPGTYEKERFASGQFNSCMAQRRLYAFNAKCWLGRTYFGTTNTKRIIDFVVWPRSLAPCSNTCGTLGRLGKRRQLINTYETRDRVPLCCTLPLAGCTPRSSTTHA